jgi:hypothetical protein
MTKSPEQAPDPQFASRHRIDFVKWQMFQLARRQTVPITAFLHELELCKRLDLVEKYSESQLDDSYVQRRPGASGTKLLDSSDL